MTWQDLAACHGEPVELWFPSRDEGQKLDYSAARQICERCPVQPECLEHALTHNERHGMWGGRTERQRWKLRRYAGRAAAWPPTVTTTTTQDAQ